MGVEQGGTYLDEAGAYGGAADFNLSMGAGGDSFAIDYASQYAPIDYAPYEPTTGLEPPVFEPLPGSPFGGSDYYIDYLNYWLDQGLDFTTATELAAQDVQEVAGESILISTFREAPLPDTSLPSFPMQSFVDPWSWVQPYTPIFPDLPPPAPPPLPPSPATRQPNLPPACPGGTYHPYPIGHPQQNICVPFPPAQTGSRPQQQQKAPAQQAPKPPTQQQRPQQQQCPTGYTRDPLTGQCKPQQQAQTRCATPETVFDQATGRCVSRAQAISPSSEGAEGLLDELTKLPWWIWLALGGLILLSRDGEGGKKTTVTYRRAS